MSLDGVRTYATKEQYKKSVCMLHFNDCHEVEK